MAEILVYLVCEIWQLKYNPKTKTSHFKSKLTDEGNWRNDYPDEDEQWSDSSQDRKYYEDYGFDSGELTSKAGAMKMIKVCLAGLGAAPGSRSVAAGGRRARAWDRLFSLQLNQSLSQATFKIYFPLPCVKCLINFLKHCLL